MFSFVIKRKAVEKRDLFKAYEKFELTEGRAPRSVFELCSQIELEEADFYTEFSSLVHLRKRLLRSIVDTTLGNLDEDENYNDFSAREKLLALFFTLFEELKGHRSYMLQKYNSNDPRVVKELSADWKDFLGQLDARVEGILMEAKSEEEIVAKPYISSHYSKGFKLVFTYVFKVWLKDESDDFETTDVAIEKAINLSFDLLGKGPLDSILDFGKFALKTKVM